nr:Chain C, VAL-SER-PHE-ILE-GLU-PHE-VAL-ILE [synthetic construct]
VSFIEFVI